MQYALWRVQNDHDEFLTDNLLYFAYFYDEYQFHFVYFQQDLKSQQKYLQETHYLVLLQNFQLLL